jgi:hypothetical protein
MKEPTVEIQLERENKIYFPGETVEGTVVLTCVEDEDVISRRDGVFVNFEAKAASQWIKCSDNSCKRLTGETVFHDEVKTLYGASYQTGSLRTTGQKEGRNVSGEALDFDKIPGVGEVYIPCQRSAEKNMRIKIVAIGAEKVIDVPDLIEEKGGKQSFYLTTAIGNMVRGPINVSCEFRPYSHVFPGKTDYPLCFILRVLRLSGLKKGTKNVNVQVYDLTDVKEERLGPGQVYPVDLPVGEMSYPFSFKIREDAPGSAHWTIGKDAASVTYSLKAFFDLKQKDTTEPIKVLFTVLPNRPLARPTLLSPYIAESGDQPMAFGCCRPLSKTYKVSVKLCLGRLVYSPGELVDMTGSAVVNNSSTPQRTQIVWSCFLQLDGGYGQKHSLSTDFVAFETVIPEKSTMILNNLPEWEGVRVPAVYPSYSGVYLDTDKTNRLETCVKWAYTLEIRLPDWGNGFYCRTPFLVSAAPPYTLQLAAHREEKSNPELTGQWSIFEHAVSGTRDCITSPTLLSAKDDKGRKAIAHFAEPIWIGGSGQEYGEWRKKDGNDKRLQEWMETRNDKEFPDLPSLFFRDIVNMFAGPSGRLTEEES